ncbi:nucleoside-triphosphatase [Lacrimispora xylanisolvens]|uniref:Nucleoside-triphosphatase n=1 Tax=Lacrimispora xylanisolvens TaxID=384636 RepID=A0A2S6HRE5_9FIRM|nr:nucleoside-triphosphatase [Hungatella xylanolytica]PPK80204.1 nucleoside-triphosphatase [Hungatella xylanolytica]
MKQKKSLFLTGNSGEGKTTLLFQCLKPYRAVTGGFFSQRLVSESGDTVGFRLASANEEWEPKICYQDGLTNIFLKRTKEGMVSFPEVFQKEGRELLTSHGDHKLILLDEIGGVELLIPEFMEAVYACLNGPKPCIGVIKSRNNFAMMMARNGGNSSAFHLRDELEESVRMSLRNQLLTYHRKDEEAVREKILKYLREGI